MNFKDFLNESITISNVSSDVGDDSKVLKRLGLTYKEDSSGKGSLSGEKTKIINYLKSYNGWSKQEIMDEYPELYK